LRIYRNTGDAETSPYMHMRAGLSIMSVMFPTDYFA